MSERCPDCKGGFGRIVPRVGVCFGCHGEFDSDHTDELRAEIAKLKAYNTAQGVKIKSHTDAMIDFGKHFRIYNGGVLCDDPNGPCACGAWHSIPDFLPRILSCVEGMAAEISKLKAEILTLQETPEFECPHSAGVTHKVGNCLFCENERLRESIGPVLVDVRMKHGDIQDATWNPAAHVELTLTIGEVRRLAAAKQGDTDD